MRRGQTAKLVIRTNTTNGLLRPGAPAYSLYIDNKKYLHYPEYRTVDALGKELSKLYCP